MRIGKKNVDANEHGEKEEELVTTIVEEELDPTMKIPYNVLVEESYGRRNGGTNKRKKKIGVRGGY